MEKIIITSAESGQRADKFLAKYLCEAPKSFIYKMLRKKNIKLNGVRCQGSEQLEPGDEMELFLSDETISKFQKKNEETTVAIPSVDVLYENKHIIFLNKPVGVLSQKAKKDDISLVEQMQHYLKQSGTLTDKDLRAFTPGICNRLDRNTSGVVIGGKSLYGLQTMSGYMKSRNLHKYYLCIVVGCMTKGQSLHGYLKKDCGINQVKGYDAPGEDRVEIRTEYEVLDKSDNYSLLKVNLITGKSHQIRAHLASIGHPILGDTKYGNRTQNARAKKQWKVNSQLLHAWQLSFSQMEEELFDLRNCTITAPVPDKFKSVLKDLFPKWKGMK